MSKPISFKIRVHSLNESEAIQRELFRCDIQWHKGNNKICHENISGLIIRDDNITYSKRMYDFRQVQLPCMVMSDLQRLLADRRTKRYYITGEKYGAEANWLQYYLAC